MYSTQQYAQVRSRGSVAASATQSITASVERSIQVELLEVESRPDRWRWHYRIWTAHAFAFMNIFCSEIIRKWSNLLEAWLFFQSLHKIGLTHNMHAFEIPIPNKRCLGRISDRTSKLRCGSEIPYLDTNTQFHFLYIIIASSRRTNIYSRKALIS